MKRYGYCRTLSTRFCVMRSHVGLQQIHLKFSTFPLSLSFQRIEQRTDIDEPTGTIPSAYKGVECRPVFFIEKYSRLIDTSNYDLDRWKDVSLAGPKTSNEPRLTQGNVDFLIGAVKQTDSFESLSSKLSLTIEKEETKLQREASQTSICVDEKADRLFCWTSTKIDPSKLPSYYLQLSKSRLTLLVASTSAAGFAMAPFQLFEPKLLLASTVGVILTSAAANTINQYLEVPFDSQMNRTKNRVLVRGLLLPRHALGFATVCMIAGCTILGHFVNLTAMGLAAVNIILYTCLYTPLKRLSIINTWVGSVVGAIPPLIGWASATGGALEPSSLVLAGILFAWQFPHFNALSWNLRLDYSKAGYRMSSVTAPELCRSTSVRYSLACIGICSVAAPLLQLTTLSFALESLPLNCYLTYLSWRFYKEPDSASARKLFRFTLLHLPLLMTLLFVEKNRRNDSSSKLKSS